MANERGAWSTWRRWAGGSFPPWAGWGGTARSSVTLLRAACDLKLTDVSFLEFLISRCQTVVDYGQLRRPKAEPREGDDRGPRFKPVVHLT